MRGGDQARQAENAHGARVDTMLNLEPFGITALDYSCIHPAAATYSAAASVTPGAAANLRDAQKQAAYATADPHGYHFIPITVESYGRLGTPAMQFLNRVSAVAAQAPGVQDFDKNRFVENALGRISVALRKGVAVICRTGAQRFAASCGHNFDPGLADPTDSP